MGELFIFQGEGFRKSAIRYVGPVSSTVSGRYPFFFLVLSGGRTHIFFFPTEQEAQNARTHFLHLLGKSPA